MNPATKPGVFWMPHPEIAEVTSGFVSVRSIFGTKSKHFDLSLV